jgi:hypothetical protein
VVLAKCVVLGLVVAVLAVAGCGSSSRRHGVRPKALFHGFDLGSVFAYANCIPTECVVFTKHGHRFRCNVKNGHLSVASSNTTSYVTNAHCVRING